MVLKLTPTVRFTTESPALLLRNSPSLTSLTILLSFQPPANAFVPKEQIVGNEEHYPLEMNFCTHCAHLQLSCVIAPEVLFRNYVYVSGTSPVMVQHLKDYAREAVEIVGLEKHDMVFEFGSNDGTLLQQFKDNGFVNVLGMDPARNIAEIASARGLQTIPDFFNPESAQKVRKLHGQARLICANHCCAHIDDLIGVVHGVKELLASDGIWIFEVGYLLKVLKDSLFDTIYHEHLDFHSLKPIQQFCETQDLRLLHASSNCIQGDSLRCFVGWKNSSPTVPGGTASISALIEEEAALGLHSEATFLRWVRHRILTLHVIYFDSNSVVSSRISKR